jgi:hypothetical protein
MMYRYRNMNTFNRIALEVQNSLSRYATSEKDAEWQRVNSYIADTLKDAHVLYAKLARLQGDFVGNELEELEKISENVLTIGGKLSSFSKAFYEGKLRMNEGEVYGEDMEHPMSGGSFHTETESAPESGESPSESKEAAPESGDVDVEFDYESAESEGGESKKKSKED